MEEGEKRTYQEKIEAQLKGFAVKIEELAGKRGCQSKVRQAD
jgi:hypothetical protein